MRTINRLVVAFCLGLVVFGCSSRKEFDGPTVDAFHGKVTHNGQPVQFAEGEGATLGLYHVTGKRFGIPLKTDGTFEIGWMPIGKYTILLERRALGPGGKGGGPSKTRYEVPGGLTIEDGKTDYDIELGNGFKP